MKRLVEDFDDMMNIEDEVSVEDTKSPLEKELIRVYEYLKDKGETDIKSYEGAYQEAIENIYPENSWWEVIDLNIFWDLFENQNPRTTIDNIISSIKPEFKKEVIDTVVTEDIEEENPLKDIRSNIIEFPNGEYAYVEYADGKLYAGSATNRGIIHEYEMDYDKDFDVDRNLQNFFDKIIEENPELGEPLDESKKDKVRERATRAKRGSLIETKYSDYLDSELYSRIANDAWHKREVKSFDNDFDTVIAFLHTLPSAELVDLAVDTGIYDFSMPDSFDAVHRDEYLKDRLAGLTEDDFEEIAERIDDTVLDALGFHSWYRKNVGKVTRLRECAGLAEGKKVCEDTVKQGNKWVNKGKDGTHGTFRTKKAADAQRKAMFANKGKKSTFGESFKVGDTFTNAGEEWEILRSEGDYTLVYAKDRKFYPYVVVYRLDDDGTWAQGHYFSNKDSAEKFLMNETGSVNESKQRKRRNRCVTEAKQERLSRKQRAKRIYESMKRKPKKNLKEATDDEIRLFMNTWANYNENGADDGITPTGWMSLDEAEEYAEKYAEYEPFINDTENVPIEFDVDEYSNIPETIDTLRKYEDFDDWQREVFVAFIDNGYNVDEAFSIVDDDDYFYIKGDSDTDLAYNYIDETGGIEELGRDTLEQYFDYDSFGRDLAFDFIKTENGYVSH